jgi:hypothetical protein
MFCDFLYPVRRQQADLVRKRTDPMSFPEYSGLQSQRTNSMQVFGPGLQFGRCCDRAVAMA